MSGPNKLKYLGYEWDLVSTKRIVPGIFSRVWKRLASEDKYKSYRYMLTIDSTSSVKGFSEVSQMIVPYTEYANCSEEDVVNNLLDLSTSVLFFNGRAPYNGEY